MYDNHHFFSRFLSLQDYKLQIYLFYADEEKHEQIFGLLLCMCIKRFLCLCHRSINLQSITNIFIRTPNMNMHLTERLSFKRAASFVHVDVHV